MTQSGDDRRLRRAGLYGPFVVLAIFVVALSGWWFWRATQAERGLDAQRARGTLAWQGRRLHGYPFRVDFDFDGLVWRYGGWSLAAPRLRAEESVFAPGHWVGVVADGVTVGRPSGGAVLVKAKVLRASISALPDHPPTVSVEGMGLDFAPAPGAAAFLLSAAAEAHLHSRAEPSGQGAFMIEIDKATPAFGSWLAAIAGGGQANLVLDGLYSHAAAFSGAPWASAARAWADSGGGLDVRRLHFQAGRFRLDAAGAGLTADADGRLKGVLNADLVQVPQAVAALARIGAVDPSAARTAAAVAGASGRSTRLPLTFLAGRTALGATALAASPKVY
jgi:hypothetical protein